MAAEIEGKGKGARDVEKTVGEPRATLSDQKIGVREARRGAFPVPLNQLSVEDLHAVGHGTFYGTLYEEPKVGGAVLSGWIEAGRNAGLLLLNAVLPPQCLACSAIVEKPGHLCSSCFARFTFITPPHCGICGLPIDQAITDDLICGACVVERPSYGRARAVFLYDDHSRQLVLKLKHGDRTDMAVHLAKWMHRSGAELISGADVIVPVPLHRLRLVSRTYNQSALLARALGEIAAKRFAADALTRAKSTASQGGLSRAQRRRNVAGAFAVSRPGAVEGKHVLLIDDVLTSGATANACSLALFQAGARSVDVLVLARVPAPAGSG